MKRSYLLVIMLAIIVILACNPLAQEQPTSTPIALVPTSEASPSPTPPDATATLVLPSPTETANPATKVPVVMTPTTPGAPRRVQFQVGGTSARVEGTVAANATEYYVVRALGGQTMTVELISASTQPQLLLQISGADGNPLKSMAVGGPYWSGALPKSQDYLIAIATDTGAAASYKLEITIPPLGK